MDGAFIAIDSNLNVATAFLNFEDFMTGETDFQEKAGTPLPWSFGTIFWDFGMGWVTKIRIHISTPIKEISSSNPL